MWFGGKLSDIDERWINVRNSISGGSLPLFVLSFKGDVVLLNPRGIVLLPQKDFMSVFTYLLKPT